MQKLIPKSTIKELHTLKPTQLSPQLKVMVRTSSVAVLIGVLLLPACSLFEPEEPEDAELVGTVWQLTHTTSLNGTERYAPQEEDIYAFRLMEGDSMAAQSDCNGCGGTYEVISDDSISVHLSCTEMACDGGFGEFPVVMYRAGTYEVQGDYLRLSTEGDNPPAYNVEEHEVLYFEATECREEILFCE